MLVTIARYRDITNDNDSSSAVVEDALTDAQALLEEEIRRPLEQGTRTERCRVFPEPRGATVYPSAIPVISVSNPSGASIEGHAVVGGEYGTESWSAYVTVTYVGGFDPASISGDVDYVPRTIERAIAWAARALVDPDTFASVPSGATSATVGDVSLTWGPGGAPAQGEVVFDRKLVKRWRRRLDLVA